MKPAPPAHVHRQVVEIIPGPHVIADIDFHTQPKRPADLAPMACSCGWTGTGGAFAAHRAEQNQPRAWIGKVRRQPAA